MVECRIYVNKTLGLRHFSKPFRNVISIILDEPGYFLGNPVSEFSEETLGKFEKIIITNNNFKNGVLFDDVIFLFLGSR